MFSIIILPDNFVASTTAIIATISNDLSTYIILIVGVLLSVIVIEIIIGALRK